jgi:geranyl-CoA carboxylase alpha subunit
MSWKAARSRALSARVGDSALALRLLACDGRWATAEIDGVRRRLAYQQRGERLWLYGANGNLAFSDASHAPARTKGGAASAR